MLSHWPIRYKLLFGTTLLCLIVAILSFSSFRGVYAYRQLVRGISRRAAELEPASNLTAKVGELRFTLRQVQPRPGFPGQPRSDMGVMREHFEANLIAVKSALQGYQDALEGSNAEDPFIGDKRREYETVQQIRHCLDRITELKKRKRLGAGTRRERRVGRGTGTAGRACRASCRNSCGTRCVRFAMKSAASITPGSF